MLILRLFGGYVVSLRHMVPVVLRRSDTGPAGDLVVRALDVLLAGLGSGRDAVQLLDENVLAAMP